MPFHSRTAPGPKVQPVHPGGRLEGHSGASKVALWKMLLCSAGGTSLEDAPWTLRKDHTKNAPSTCSTSLMAPFPEVPLP